MSLNMCDVFIFFWAFRTLCGPVNQYFVAWERSGCVRGLTKCCAKCWRNLSEAFTSEPPAKRWVNGQVVLWMKIYYIFITQPVIWHINKWWNDILKLYTLLYYMFFQGPISSLVEYGSDNENFLKARRQRIDPYTTCWLLQSTRDMDTTKNCAGRVMSVYVRNLT